jgi:hypothetical protein
LAVIVLCASCNKLGAKSKQESLLEYVPEKALAAVIVRADALKILRQQLEEDQAMQKELSQYLTDREGIDLSAISAVVAFVTTPDAHDGAALLRMPVHGTPKWQKVGDADGTPIYKVTGPVVAAVLPTGVLVGTEPGLRMAIATATKKAPAVGKQSPLAPLLDIDQSAQLLVASSIDAVSDRGAQAAAGLYGIQVVTAGYQPDKLFVWANGQVGGLKAARDAAKGFIDLGLQKAKEERDKAKAGDNTLEGVATIVGCNSYARMAPKLTPRLEGERLVVDYPIPVDGKTDGTTTMMTYASVAGILAAVAIPAFMRYQRRGKTVEATMNLRKLFDSEVMYYEAEHVDSKGRLLPKSFAAAADWTPTTRCCEQLGGKCAPDPKLWEGEPWRSLEFSIDDPFNYQYRVVKKADGFVVEARGDLDCDGVFSTFRREGHLDQQGMVSGGEGLQSENDTE